MTPILSALLPVFLAIVAGVLLRHWVIREEAHWVGIERLTYYVLVPALLIETLSTADLAKVPALGVGAALFIAIILMSLLLVVVRPVLMRRLGVNGPAFTSVFQGATRWNSMVGLAVAGSLYGEIGIALASVAIVAMIPVLNVINVGVLVRHAASKPPRAGDIAWALVSNPFIWSCAVGIALWLVHPPIPQPVHTFAKMLAQPALPLGLLQVGSGLRIEDICRPRAVTWMATALKLAVMPALAIAFGLAFGLSGTNLSVVVACAAVPSASNAYILARQMGGDAPLVAEIVTLQTVVAVVTMPALLALVA
jgi:malonate transporter and related proteins